MASVDDQFRTTALEEANKWASARAAAGAHPGSGDVVEVAEKFYLFLKGKTSSSS